MASPEEQLDLAALQEELRAEAAELRRMHVAAQGFSERIAGLESEAAARTDVRADDAFARGPAAFAQDMDLALHPIAPLRLQALEFRDSPRMHGGNYRYSDLAEFEDRAFIQVAYRALLRHGPDPQGERLYLQKLRSGRSKAETLLRLRYSHEGRTQRVRVRGLWFYGGLALLGRIPLLGAFGRWLIDWLCAPLLLRKSLRRQEQLRDHLNRSLLALQEKTNETARVTNQILRRQERS